MQLTYSKKAVFHFIKITVTEYNLFNFRVHNLKLPMKRGSIVQNRAIENLIDH